MTVVEVMCYYNNAGERENQWEGNTGRTEGGIPDLHHEIYNVQNALPPGGHGLKFTNLWLEAQLPGLHVECGL